MKLKKNKCCICGKSFIGFGNNPFPIKKVGVCCDDCNLSKVIPKRMYLLNDKVQLNKKEENKK